MTALEHLQGYLRGLTWRLRFFAASRGLAITAACALLLTLLFVYIGNRFEFAGGVVLPLRIVLYAAVAAVLSIALLKPLLRLNRRQVTREVEDRAPEFKERLLTIAERERTAGKSAWMELLAEDTLAIAQRNAPEGIRSSRVLFGFAGAFAVAAALLIWMITAGPGYWGYGAALLWTGQADIGKRPLYAINVQPGDRTIRRRSDQAVTAELEGFSASNVVLHARYGKASKWDAAPMEANGGNAYRFVFASVSEPVEYYVEAAHSQSRHFHIRVKDLAGVKRIRVALQFPSELGLQNVMLDPAGDIRAVAGTKARVQVETDKPLEHGVLVVDNTTHIPLMSENGNWQSANILVQKDGSYYVAAVDDGETIRISEDYFIEARKDESPTVKISRPGHDPHVSPIEEMPVTVSAADDYGVGALELHYAVNGGPERTYSLLKEKGTKDAEAKTSISFEDLKAVPGDMVSLYAVARDAHTTARSEILFAQADAFDYKFSQSQQSGGMGGGGGGNESSDISQRQKQIIAATFNQLKGSKTGAAREEDAKFLSEEQAKLGEQATTLAARMQSRELGSSGKMFEEFAKLLNQASGDMGDAVKQLKPAKWNLALAPEQKALTSLLHAEALFRDIQLSMSKGGGGGGANSNAGRDLARMFDLELDTSKNQYETGKSAPPPGTPDNQKALDEARQRLEALARRQQELAAQNMKSQAFEQRWQEEQLRREAEELKRQLQEMAKNSQSGSEQQQGGQQEQEGKPGEQGQPGQQTAQAGSQQTGQPSGSEQSGSSQSGAQQSGGQRMGSNRSGSSQSQSNQTGERQSGSQQTASSRAGSREQSSEARAAAAGMQRALKEATRALDRAEEEMRNSVSKHDKSAGARAADHLRQAQQLMAEALQKQAGGTMSDLAGKAEQIASAQREIASKMKQMYGESSGDRLRRYARMPGEQSGGEDGTAMQEMNDPNMRFRRRYGMGMYYSRPGREPTATEKALAENKEKLAGEIETLQRQVQQQAQTMSGARPDASAKMLRALSDAEGKELALRLQKNAEWMRQGFGDRNVGSEDAVTNGLQQFGRALRDVEVAINAPNAPGEEKLPGRDTASGTRTPANEQAPAQFRDAVAGYFKKLSQAK